MSALDPLAGRVFVTAALSNRMHAAAIKHEKEFVSGMSFELFFWTW